MPASAILLSILGLAPFIGCGLAAIGQDAALAARMLTGLIAWGALVLAFIGGVHWGLVLRDTEGVVPAASGPVRHGRIALAVLPLILGWLALMVPLVAASWLALLLLIVGYILALAAEQRFATHVLLPTRYVWLRWAFTVVAVAMLTTVLTLRLLGQTIVL